jgi:ABC-2 type transport system permease protein
MPVTTNPPATPPGGTHPTPGTTSGDTPPRTRVVARRTFTEFARTRGVRLTALLLVLAAVGVTLWAATSGREPADRKVVDTVAVLAGLLPPLLSTLLYVGSSLTRDLANGTLASLLATAVDPREAVRGTALAVYLPGLPLMLIAPVAVEAAAGHRAVTVPLVLAALGLTPALGWMLTTLTIRLAVIQGPETALVPLWLIAILVLMGVPVGSLLGGFDVASWAVLALYTVGAACLALAVWATSPALTRQRVALAR